MNYPKENKVFQRPCHTVLLPPQCFATTVVNYYDRSIFSMVGSLGGCCRVDCPPPFFIACVDFAGIPLTIVNFAVDFSVDFLSFV